MIFSLVWNWKTYHFIFAFLVFPFTSFAKWITGIIGFICLNSIIVFKLAFDTFNSIDPTSPVNKPKVKYTRIDMITQSVTNLSSSESAWKVLSTTVVKWRPRIIKVNLLGLSVRMISQFLTVKLFRTLLSSSAVLGSFL